MKKTLIYNLTNYYNVVTSQFGVPAQNPEEYYGLNVALPFLSHIISELEVQFSEMSVLSAKMMNLFPSVLCTTEELPSLDDVVVMYNEDLPSPDLQQRPFNGL